MTPVPMQLTTGFCEICGKYRAGKNHPKCSQERKRRHEEADKARRAAK